MKRRYLFLAVLPLLASCGTAPDAKEVANEADFIEVADISRIKISFASAVEHTISGEKTTSGTSYRAFYYSNDDFRIETPTNNRIGYSFVGDNGTTQYCLINTRGSNGVIYSSASSLEASREATKEEIRRQYEFLGSVYSEMKTYAGKSAQELGYIQFEFRRSVAPEVAGYVVLTRRIEGDNLIESNRYLMMDKIGDNWVFTNYSIRETIYAKEEGRWVLDHYDISQYQITAVEEYSKIAINLSNYALTVEGIDINGVSYDDGCPLTAR